MNTFTDELRKYSLQNLLLEISKLSNNIFNSSSDSNLPFNIATKTLHYIEKGVKKETPIYITVWDLIDLSYLAIKYANDYRKKTIQSEYELIRLIQLYHTYRNTLEGSLPYVKNETNDPKQHNDFMLFLYGFMGEQLKFQTADIVFENHMREEYILKEIGKHDDTINLEKIVFSELGMNSSQLSATLLSIWGGATQNPQIKNYEWFEDGLLSKDNISRVVDYYSASYEEIRNSPLKRQMLYIKPFINTDKFLCLACNPMLIFFLYQNSTYWILRDFYRRKNSQKFINAFGIYYEQYMLETLGTYLDKSEFEKIPETNAPRADWRIDLNGTKLLIEQKSALIALNAKQQQTDINPLKTHIKNTIIKSIHQLSETESHYNDGTYIKIILRYDDYLEPEILDRIFIMDDVLATDDGYYWLLSTNEIEKLLYLYKNDVAKFEDIVKEKTKLEVTKSNDGRSLTHLFKKHGLTNNPHMEQEKFKKFRKEEHAIIHSAFGNREILFHL